MCEKDGIKYFLNKSGYYGNNLKPRSIRIHDPSSELYPISKNVSECNYKSSAGQSAVKGGMYLAFKIIFGPQQHLESSSHWQG